MGNGPLRLFWFLTSQGYNLAELICADPGWSSWAGQVLQSFFYTQIVQGDGLQLEPTFPPQSHHVQGDAQFLANMNVRRSFCRSQNNSASYCNLLTNRMAADQFF
jgi:hypothetical protein